MKTDLLPSLLRRMARGFTLVELLVVIGVIALLVSMLLPALAKARQQAMNTQCKSNLHQVGLELLMYANNNRGWMYPPERGTNMVPPNLNERWPAFVFKPAVWNPPIMRCPVDLEPLDDHSYILNYHIYRKAIRYSTQRIAGSYSASEVVLMGEKISTRPDYYMDAGEFDALVEPYRHGLTVGSNYLFLDLHVETKAPLDAKSGVDPWDPAGA